MYSTRLIPSTLAELDRIQATHPERMLSFCLLSSGPLASPPHSKLGPKCSCAFLLISFPFSLQGTIWCSAKQTFKNFRYQWMFHAHTMDAYRDCKSVETFNAKGTTEIAVEEQNRDCMLSKHSLGLWSSDVLPVQETEFTCTQRAFFSPPPKQQQQQKQQPPKVLKMGHL